MALSLLCWEGDIDDVKAALANGASANLVDVPLGQYTPLAAAVTRRRLDIVKLLLCHGADPNGVLVMTEGCLCSSYEILQLLIDAGGDVNERNTDTRPALLFCILTSCLINGTAKIKLLLAQPLLDLAKQYNGIGVSKIAKSEGHSVLADIIKREIKRRAALTHKQLVDWHAVSQYAAAQRLAAAGLTDIQNAPCVRELFKTIRFVWIAVLGAT
jgi:hypothetical protein